MSSDKPSCFGKDMVCIMNPNKCKDRDECTEVRVDLIMKNLGR